MESKPSPSEACPRTLACYRLLIRLYPKSFQVDFGPATLQVIRDLYREYASQSKTPSIATFRLWLRLLPDFFVTFCQEHYAQWKGNNSMKKWTDPSLLSFNLLLLGLGLGSVSLALMFWPGLCLGLMHVTASVFLIHAIAEWRRPHEQWLRSLLNGLVVAVAFAVFLPAWAKVAHEHNLRHLIVPSLVMAVLGLNLAVGILKGSIILFRKSHSKTATL